METAVWVLRCATLGYIVLWIWRQMFVRLVETRAYIWTSGVRAWTGGNGQLEAVAKGMHALSGSRERVSQTPSIW
jgi:hypothetical protein